MKITRILVALSFLFAVVTANAGQLTVNGSITATYQSEVNNVTGNPFGMDRELSFTGSTELDNGITVSYLQDTSESLTFGDTELVFGNVLGLATLRLGSDYDPMDAADDITPSAFEEANGGGSGDYTATGQDIGALRTLGTHVGGAIAIPYLGNLAANYYPKTDGTENADGGSSGGANSIVGSGYSATLTTPMNGLPLVGSMLDGLVLTTGIEEQETSTVASTSDRLGLTAALNYAYGPIKIGYQKKFADLGQTTSATAGTVIYRDDIIGIAYAVNDSLSLSWNRYDSVRSTAADANVEQSTTAINIGYTVGGMTFGFQDASTDNSGYTTGTNNDTRRLQLAVAF